MTKIRVSIRPDGVRMTASGHAEDKIACAMVSTLVYMLAGYAKNFGTLLEEKLEEGDAVVDAYGDLRQASIAFLIGAKNIARTYPHEVTVKAIDKEINWD